MKEKKKKRQKWIRLRHRIVQHLLCPFMALFLRAKYGLRYKKFHPEHKQYLILANHQTAWDQFFMGLVLYPKIMPYYVATEDIFSNGFISKLIRFLVNPIPIKKQTSDVSCVMNCIRIVREGGSIAISPEGNRTFDGRTVSMKSSIASLARALKIPLACLRIEGGYGVQPRWGDGVRRGRIDAYVSRVVSVEEIKAMTDDELFALIEKELYVNDCESGKRFCCGKRAEHMERAFYVCPECGISEFRSKGDVTVCTRCGKAITLGEDLTLSTDTSPLPFHDTAGWYDYQCEYLHTHDTSLLTQEPLHTGEVAFYEIEPYKRKHLLAKNAKVALFGDRYEITYGEKTEVFSFEDVRGVTVLGKKKVNFYTKENLYQLKGDCRFPLLEYMNLYFNYNNIKGGRHDRFLGI